MTVRYRKAKLPTSNRTTLISFGLIGCTWMGSKSARRRWLEGGRENGENTHVLEEVQNKTSVWLVNVFPKGDLSLQLDPTVQQVSA